jgi:hypothetical protein
MENLSVLLLLLVLIFVYFKINPKFDWNYETGEKLLWFNDPFDSLRRKAVTLWKTNKKED